MVTVSDQPDKNRCAEYDSVRLPISHHWISKSDSIRLAVSEV